MIDYDKSQDPPALMLPVTISKAGRTLPRRTAPALLDIGADISAIPKAFLSPLKLHPVGRILFEGVEARQTVVFTYAIRLKIADLVIPRLKVVVTDFDFAVIGRDVLNRFYMLLNGPELTFDLSQTPFITKE